MARTDLNKPEAVLCHKRWWRQSVREERHINIVSIEVIWFVTYAEFKYMKASGTWTCVWSAWFCFERYFEFASCGQVISKTIYGVDSIKQIIRIMLSVCFETFYIRNDMLIINLSEILVFRDKISFSSSSKAPRIILCWHFAEKEPKISDDIIAPERGDYHEISGGLTLAWLPWPANTDNQFMQVNSEVPIEIFTQFGTTINVHRTTKISSYLAPTFLIGNHIHSQHM